MRSDVLSPLPPPVEEHSNLLLILAFGALGLLMSALTWVMKRVVELVGAAVTAKLAEHDKALNAIRELLGDEIGKLREEIGGVHEKVNDVKDHVALVSERTRALEEQVSFHLGRRKGD